MVLVPALATKEYAEDISELLDDPDLILELVKRLESDLPSSSSQKKSFPVPSLPDKHSNGYPVQGDNSCKTRLFKKTIIKTDDSRKAGANFLGSEENVTNDACVSKCCAKTGCDLAVYENKVIFFFSGRIIYVILLVISLPNH